MATGLLVNQIGYDSRSPIRIVFRSDHESMLQNESVWKLFDEKGNPVANGMWQYWGLCWKEHWWVVELSLKNGSFRIETTDQSDRSWEQIFDVIEQPYLKSTFEHVALGQFERRAHIPTVANQGWIDCGAYLSEANPHAVTVYGMVMFATQRGDELDEESRDRLLKQIKVGCDYFLFLAKEAKNEGFPEGTYVHEPVASRLWILNDCLQIGLAACTAARLFIDKGDTAYGQSLVEMVSHTYQFLMTHFDEVIDMMNLQVPAPIHNEDIDLLSLSRHTHSYEQEIPDSGEWMTKELLVLLAFQLELETLQGRSLKSEIFRIADLILERWVISDEKAGEYGIAYWSSFPGSEQAEVAWSHHSVGRDTGGVFAHLVLPLHVLLQRYSDYPSFQQLSSCLDYFIGNYLRAASEANPFSLLPNTWKKGEGWNHFAGIWHGMNASYALHAMQCFYFSKELNLPWLYQFGKAQLDWIAGLNCGLTKDSLYGALMYDRDMEDGVALPVSMIHGVGRDYAGNWRTIRGSICNGFSRGKQFRFDVEPKVEEDFPDSFTDEDWISHAGAWLAALAYSDL